MSDAEGHQPTDDVQRQSWAVDHWPDDPDLARLGQSFRDGLRAEAQEDEQLAAKDLLRARHLDDVALELLARGDRVEVVTGGLRLVGEVVHAARDLACVDTVSGVVDVHLAAPLAVRVIERVRSGGGPRARGASSFRARLAQHEAAGTPMELRCPALGLDVVGRLAAVGADHVVLDEAGGERTYLALAAIALVRPAAKALHS